MKKAIFIISCLIFLFTSCKIFQSQRTIPETTYQPALEADGTPKVFSVPDPVNITNTEEVNTNTNPISVRRENVTPVQEQDATKVDNNNYFVIIGSFSILENAITYRENLINEGFSPIILQSETAGYYRVCVNSYQNEEDARRRVSLIRQQYPKYFDTWLLIKE